MASKKKPDSQPEPQPRVFCTLSFETGEYKFSASGPEDYINRQKRWFMEERDVGHQAEESRSDQDAG
jgi:hypothetical protein